MTRATQQISIFLAVAAVYASLYLQYIPILPHKIQEEVLPVLPLWALVTFGAYLLSQVGWNLLFFNNAPEAQASLMKEIEVARGELRGMGVDVD